MNAVRPPRLTSSSRCLCIGLLLVGLVLWKTPLTCGAGDETDSNGKSTSPKAVPRVSSNMIAQIPIIPTHVLVSYPIRCADEDAQAAISRLRLNRSSIVQAMIDLGADPKMVHSVLFRVGEENDRSRSFLPQQRNNVPLDPPPKIASCVVVGIFELIDSTDPETMMSQAQTKLSELESVLPAEESAPASGLRVTSYSTRPSQLSATKPDVLYATFVTQQHVGAAFKQATENAMEQLSVLADASGQQMTGKPSVSNSGVYSVSTRYGDPGILSNILVRHPKLLTASTPDSLVYQARAMVSASTN